MWLTIAVVTAVTSGVWYFYTRIPKSIPCRCRCQTELDGKTVLITGANCGLGYLTALGLAKKNPKLILACRNKESAEEAAEKIKNATGNQEIYVRQVDLNSLASIRSFAEKFLKEETRLDILINNAGVSDGFRGRFINEDGIEHIMAVNYCAPFLLTNLLLDLIKKSQGKIVNLGSRAQLNCKSLELDKLFTATTDMNGQRYRDSKCYLHLCTRQLAKRLQDTGVTVNSVHPGTTLTKINKAFMIWDVAIYILLKLSMVPTNQDCAETVIHLSLAPEFSNTSGEYIDKFNIADPGVPAQDDMFGEKLWDFTEKITGLKS